MQGWMGSCLACLAFGCVWFATAASEPVRPSVLPAPQPAFELPAEVRESSGLVHLRGLLWTHGDSGQPACLWAVDTQGKLQGTLTLTGARNLDWEDLASDAQGRLLLVDAGDNGRARATIQVYRVAVPELPGARPFQIMVAAERFEAVFPRPPGPLDVEAAVCWKGALYLFSKDPWRTQVFRMKLPEHAAAPDQPPLTLEALGALPGPLLVTGAALDREGARLALCSYMVLHILDWTELEAAWNAEPVKAAPPATLAVTAGILTLGQVEALAWDGERLWLTNEAGRVFQVQTDLKPSQP